MYMNDDSSHWESIKSTKLNEKEKNIYSFISKSDFKTLEGKTVKLSKFMGILPYSAKDVLFSITNESNWKVWDRNCVYCNNVDYVQNENYSFTVDSYAMKYLPFMKYRSGIKMSTVIYDSVRKSYSYISKTTSALGVPRLENTIKHDFYFGLTLYHISENKCRYVYVLYYHSKTFVHKIVSKKLYSMYGRKLYEGLLKSCNSSVKKNGETVRPDSHWRVLDTLDDFIEKYVSDGSEKTWSF
ncbi:hypothetical protein AKO1_005132 [Acrasis kona]|uniref:START domain-containing protein n=1 Tax=Acrasis kona TaxID=1008807 RepID=A0AAW2Z3S2_9EUKA